MGIICPYSLLTTTSKFSDSPDARHAMALLCFSTDCRILSAADAVPHRGLCVDSPQYIGLA